MHEPASTLPNYSSWKVKPYTIPPGMRLALERAQQVQPPLMSLHARPGASSTDSDVGNKARVVA
jgi:hypothetical protein